MKTLRLGVLLTGALATWVGATLRAQSAAADAPASGDTAYAALRLMAKELGKESLERVVEVSGHDGSPQPSQWTIVLQDAGGANEVEIAGSKITRSGPSSNPPGSRLPIHLQDLNLDSSGAFDAIDAQARKVRLRFDSVNYVLRATESTGKPQWTLSLFNQEKKPVGAMRLAAHDGTIVSIDGRLASAPATPAPTVSLASHRPTPTAAPTHSRESTPTVTRATETKTTTVTTVNEPAPPPPVATITDATVVDEASADHGEGGLFTRTGRTLDKTNRTVVGTLDKTNRTVVDTLRRTGTRVQRFFTNRSDSSESEETTAPPPMPSAPRDPNYRGD